MLKFSRLSAIYKCSKPSANGWIIQHLILESHFQQSDRFHFLFSQSHAKFYDVTFYSQNIDFLVYIATHSLETVFFLLWMKQEPFPLHFPYFQTLNALPIFFVGFFLHFLFSGGVCATVFIKPAITRDLFNVYTFVGAFSKDNELHICTFRRNSDRWHYKSVWRKWASVLGQPLYHFPA